VLSLDLLGVRLEQPANSPVLLLREREGRRRVLPIYIGGPEAAAIAYALEGATPPRPLTHDLLCNVLHDLGVTLTRVLVTEFKDHTYYAELHLDRGGQALVVSSRPSDAVAIAVRTGAPLFATEALLDEAGQLVDETEDADAVDADAPPEVIIEEFRAFIEDVKPEDFGG
jgi:bifunctional DNase/RNase